MENFNFNRHGVCTNPSRHTFARPGKTVEVRTAMAGGRWRYGMSVETVGGGHSFGASLRGTVFASEEAAISAALESEGCPAHQMKLF